MSGAEILGFELLAGLGVAAIRGAILAGEGAVLGAAGLALGTAAAARQWRDESGRLRACREAEVLRQLLLAEVSARNARIAALHGMCAAAAGPGQAREEAARLAATIPAPLEVVPADEIASLHAWCLATDTALEAAESAVAGRYAAGLVARLLASHPAGDERLVRAAAAPAEPGVAVAKPGTAGVADAAGAWGAEQRAEAEAALVRVLARLLPEATTEDHRGVADAAAQVVAAATPGDARTWLDEVRLRVQRANQRSIARREDVINAARMLHAIPEAAGTGAAARVRAELAEVVEGRRPLDTGLRARAEAEVALADAEADRRYVAEMLVNVLGELDYTVEEGFETALADGGLLRIRQAEWTEHAVHLRVDPDTRKVHAALVRTAPAASPAPEENGDAEREDAWCGTLEAALERLAAAGVGTTIEFRSEPGTRAVPLISDAAPDAAAPRRRGAAASGGSNGSNAGGHERLDGSRRPAGRLASVRA